ncbi:hypothetical protein PIB30_025333 [Stylosanthes scabra]|uniref:TF-B3 domain-containing protein n=1 Tax=Stylosanthes scabra TaxID=79078 RepID=A0ABU6X7J6_9FABA|nr:hypothetical protein [Stylosanthes scabra]
MSGLEIDYPSNDNSVGISKKQQRQKKKVKATPKPSSPSRSKRLKCTANTTDEEGSPDTQNWKQNANIFDLGTKGFEALIEAKRFKSENPSFIVKITKTNISASRANFQVPFYKKYFKDDEKHIQIRFEGELLPAKVCYQRHNSLAIISAGWPLFAQRSKLQIGDVTVFELINREDPLFDVHIYRAHG